jgi:hypothetical protein
MSQGAGSSGKVAALIGLTMLVGGAEISSAATIIQSQHFGPLPGPSSVTAVPLTFNLFNPSNGILTSVGFNLTGQIAETIGVTNVTATIDIPILGGSLGIGPFTITQSPITVNATNTDTGNAVLKYIGVGTFEASFAYSALCGLGTPFSCGPGFSGDVAFTYTYSPVAAVPLPAALPLFATGLGVLGLLGWRRKKKAAALAA